MDCSDQADERNFRVNFSNDGLTRLQGKVRDKLKEFLRDYTDDTLVEYVVVLLRNGKHKSEARNELDVFLRDDTDSFISWLWDHLASNLHLYVQTRESSANEETERSDQQPDHVNRTFNSGSVYETDNSVKETRRRKREWNGLIRDAPAIESPPLLTSKLENFPVEEKFRRSSALKRSHSVAHKERNQQDRNYHSGVCKQLNKHDEQQPTKRDGTSHSLISAPRRLLQFAVREAVRPLQSSVSRSEPASKRLHSAISTSIGDSSLDDHSQRTRLVARVPAAIGPVLKAAAEAAEDVIRSPVNVFDRLGCNINGASTFEKPKYKGSDLMPIPTKSDFYGGNEAMLENNTGLSSGSESDNDGYDAIGNVGHRFAGPSQSAFSRNKDDDSLMLQYSLAQDADEVPRNTRMKNQDQSVSSVANSSRKIVNISVNVNTWKPLDYQSQRDVAEPGNRTGVQDADPAAGKPGLHHASQESNAVAVDDENEIYCTDAQKAFQKAVSPMPGPYSSVRPTEDADSRTVFVSNVHFGATKDTLSRHFNKFGEVLKVIIVTDAATGKPKGSAYVEFMRKESAELALSLNGTSFMSRMLKVIQRSPAHHEAAPMMAWPLLARASPFASRVLRVAYPIGIPTAFRTRLPLKTGARSLQWKRDASSGDSAKNSQDGAPVGQVSSSTLPSSAVRSHTYIRSDPKLADRNPGELKP